MIKEYDSLSNPSYYLLPRLMPLLFSLGEFSVRIRVRVRVKVRVRARVRVRVRVRVRARVRVRVRVRDIRARLVYGQY
jgi:hypothetical protein